MTNPKSFTAHFVDVEAYVEVEKESAKALVKQAVEHFRTRGIMTTAAIVKGQPAKSIVAYAKPWGRRLHFVGLAYRPHPQSSEQKVICHSMMNSPLADFLIIFLLQFPMLHRLPR